MSELIITQETIDQAYELKEATSYLPSECCPMALQMCKYLGLEKGEYQWGFSDGWENNKMTHQSTQACDLVVGPFDSSSRKLTGPITVDIEEVTNDLS